eukprot:TRINITY_DN7534_c0_g1_i1.p1 TRINITY_DN7534_c0_g1~~TRINITY_DN7534_c0_g1_i1.p1  ORF type:complete len:615 (-),score=149.64 TRINITY_DN7534_c0_g1_i1:167-2011(-)
MELNDRLDLLKVSKISQKLEKLMECVDKFEPLIATEVGKLGAKEVFKCSNKEDSLESEMVVCVRVRPRLSHEVSSNYMMSTFTSNPEVLVVEPSFRRSVHIGDGGQIPGDMPRITPNKFTVDMAFGEEDDNNVVYEAVAQPLIDLSLQGGISTIFAYGQTGSGKTFTISGILDKLGVDLFNRKDGKEDDGLKLHLSYIQLLGNVASDLLDDNTKVDILEDKFGKVNIVGAKEEEITNTEDFMNLITIAANHRSTSTTMKNDTSSRSHAVCRIRLENTTFREAEDGFLFIIDLAGSENAADSQFHDKSRIKETKEINKSLMCLKDCIRNRAKSASEPQSFVHIPFRQSKLSLLLKDAFELESHRLCRTVVFANIAPTLADNAMTLNTLRYVAPIKMGVKNRTKIAPNPKSPANWSNEKLVEWVKKESNGKIDSNTLCPWESGKQFLSLPEAEILKRIMENNPKITEKKAKDFYVRLWKLLVDERIKERKAKMKKQTGGKLGISRSHENDDEEMIARNNELPEIELKIETATQISDKDFSEKVLKLDEVDEVKLFTVSYSSQENAQRFFIQLKTDDANATWYLTSETMKKVFSKTGLKALYCDFRDVRSEDSKFEQ